MFLHQFNKVGETFLTVKNFTLSVLNIFLKIIGSGFGNAEIFHAVGNFHPHLFTDPEKMINSIPGCENYSGKIKYIDSVLPEFLGRDAFYYYKFTKFNINAEFLDQFTIRRLF
jgi:hypothetical protein